jgi:lactate dehydrogenase-like 2-hydroxyacid dehydrogenase
MVVDEDLIAALKSGQVAAAGLDTYEGEPKLNPGYLSLNSTFLLPHIGAATIETRTARACWRWTTLMQSWEEGSLLLL